jgi:hypothetical protein
MYKDIFCCSVSHTGFRVSENKCKKLGGEKVCYSKILGYGKNQESLVYYYYFDL